MLHLDSRGVSAEYRGATCIVTDWITSCRVFSRTLESRMLEVLIEHAKVSGAQKLVPNYSPALKNAPMIDIFTNLGFKESVEDSWVASVNDIEFKPSVID